MIVYLFVLLFGCLCVASLIAVIFKVQIEEARHDLAFYETAPEGAVCSTGPQYFSMHFYGGKPDCRRCGRENPRYKDPAVASPQDVVRSDAPDGGDLNPETIGEQLIATLR